MPSKQIMPDRVLLNKVTQRLARAGLGGCSVRVMVKNGQVTLSGTIQRDLQRRPAVRAATGIDGVRQVLDQLKVEAKKPKMEFKKGIVDAKSLNRSRQDLDGEDEQKDHGSTPS